MADARQLYPTKHKVEKAAGANKNLPSGAPQAAGKRDSGTNSGNVVHVQYPKDQVIRPTILNQSAARKYSAPPKRRRNFCCRCLLWTFCMLLLFIAAVAIAAGILYAVFQPKIPEYSVNGIQITSFTVTSTDATISSQFVVEMTATNPNEKIGIYYLDDSILAVFCSGTELSRGKLPAFYQGHTDSTKLNVGLSGSKMQMSSEEVYSVNAERKKGSIPLCLKATVPVKLTFGKVKSMEITFRVRCDLVVDKLDANTTVNLSCEECKMRFGHTYY